MASSTSAVLDKYIQKARAFLEAEREAEVSEAKSRIDGPARGILGKLAVVETKPGFGGTTLVCFAPAGGNDAQDGGFAGFGVGSGDVVQIRPRKSKPGPGGSHPAVTGTVSGVSRKGISVLLATSSAISPSSGDGDSGDEDMLLEGGLFRMDKLANDVTYRRMCWALDKVAQYQAGGSNLTADVFFHSVSSQLRSSYFGVSDQAKHRLNESQIEAVSMGLNVDRVGVIWGPPGTGKTTALVELIIDCVRVRGDKVLVCAPSNCAVDNLVERLVRRDERLFMVRLGNPARMLPSVLDRSLDQLVEAEYRGVGMDIAKEMNGIYRKLGSKKTARSERYELQRVLRSLQKELRAREKDAVRFVLQRSQVILCTCSGAGDRCLNVLPAFDTVIIDEAAQATEPTAWIPSIQGGRLILCGDNKQLPPTILTTSASRNYTLFDHASKLKVPTVMLTRQYRMNGSISQWSSCEMYDGELVADASVECHLLAGLNGVSSTDETSAPLIFVDTAGCDFEETFESSQKIDEFSIENNGEAKVVSIHVERLVNAGVLFRQISVISPYAGQVRRLRKTLSEEIEIDTVDGFQGRENEAIVISLVRSNDTGQVGFLSDSRRLNVAITRAKRHVCVIGDSATISSDPFIERFISYVDKCGLYRSGYDYIAPS